VIGGTPRLVVGASRLVAGTPRCSQVHATFPLVLEGVPQLITNFPMVRLYQSSAISVTPKAGRSALLQSDALLKLTHLSLHSASSQTLLEAPTGYNSFCSYDFFLFLPIFLCLEQSCRSAGGFRLGHSIAPGSRIVLSRHFDTNSPGVSKE
jgi:hypothetical protein